jgi:hypothetical protein
VKDLIQIPAPIRIADTVDAFLASKRMDTSLRENGFFHHKSYPAAESQNTWQKMRASKEDWRIKSR